MIRTAILGAGIGREHLAALRELPEFDVVAVVDRDTARAEEIREGDGFKALAEIDDVLGDPAIDLIDICLPPHLHVPVSLQALQAGKHVVCEKPLATALSDIDRLSAAMADSGTDLFPVFQYRWGPSLAQLRQLQRLGLTGHLHSAAFETHWARGADYYAVPWRGTWAGEQGGAVLGHAIHAHDLLTHLAGPVASLSALTSTRVNPIETEDCAAIAFQMTSGAVATSNITLGAAQDETRLRLVFEHLTATSGTTPYAPGMDPWTFTARDPAHQGAIDDALRAAPQEPIGFAGYFTELAKALNGAPNTAVRFDDGAASVALVTAIYHAARTGQRVDLPLRPDHPLYQGWQP